MNRICLNIPLALLLSIAVMDRASAQTPIYIEPGPVTWDSTTNPGTFPVYFTSTEEIAGFQFDVVFDSPTGILSGAGGGLAGTYGYDIGTGATTVLGFSITLTEIPPANTPESLVDIFITTTSGDPDYGTICLENPVFADVAANSLPVTIGPCWPSSVLLRRGDCNVDGSFNVADVVFLLAQLFTGGPSGSCQDACDSNDDGGTNIGDAIYALAALFTSGTPPADPGPQNCGPDPTTDALDCVSYSLCP